MGYFSKSIQNNYGKPERKKSKPKKARPEALLQDAIMKYLKSNNWQVIRINSSVMISDKGYPIRSYLIYGLGMSAGFSDLIALKKDRFLLLEVKTKTGRLTQTQKKVKANFELQGINYHVVRNVSEVQDIINSL